MFTKQQRERKKNHLLARAVHLSIDTNLVNNNK